MPGPISATGFPFQGNAAVLDTPEGPINYWVIYPKMSERHAVGAGGTTRVRIALNWDDVATFKTYALGTTKVGGSQSAPQLVRYTPLLCPWTEAQYLTQMTLVEVGETAQNPAGPDPFIDPLGSWWAAEWAVYECDFSFLPYPIVKDDDMLVFLGTSIRDETQRYCTISRHIHGRERKVSEWQFETDDGLKIPGVGFVPDYEIEYVVTLYQWPYLAVPDDAIATSIDTVNDGVFLDKPSETLLFKGTRTPIEPMPEQDNTRMVVLSYIFSYRKNGWNSYRKTDGTWVGMHIVGQPSVRPYTKTDFRQLLKPVWVSG